MILEFKIDKNRNKSFSKFFLSISLREISVKSREKYCKDFQDIISWNDERNHFQTSFRKGFTEITLCLQKHKSTSTAAPASIPQLSQSFLTPFKEIYWYKDTSSPEVACASPPKNFSQDTVQMASWYSFRITTFSLTVHTFQTLSLFTCFCSTVFSCVHVNILTT